MHVKIFSPIILTVLALGKFQQNGCRRHKMTPWRRIFLSSLLLSSTFQVLRNKFHYDKGWFKKQNKNQIQKLSQSSRSLFNILVTQTISFLKVLTISFRKVLIGSKSKNAPENLVRLSVAGFYSKGLAKTAKRKRIQ